MRFSSLCELLKERAVSTDKGITFIEGNDREETVAYGELYDRALRVLAFLQEKGLRPGDELVLQIDDNKLFILVFWGCLLGGIIPVPLTIGRNDAHRQKLFTIWAVLHNPFVILAGDEEDPRMAGRTIRVCEIFSSGRMGAPYDAQPGDIAFIQFSSGSTGNPKGVVLTHGNLLADIQGIGDAARYSADDRMLSWMPLTHDMGLIGFHINPLFTGMHHYLMPAQLFVHKPALWMDTAAAHRITILSSPNFGYDHFLKHCDPASAKYAWDLSAVRLIYNGAEPISEELGRRFLNRMAGYGLRKTALRPVYGLAEGTLAVTISGLDEEMQAVNISRDRLNLGDRIVPAASAANSVSFVNVGSAIGCCAIRIADAQDAGLPDETIGHVQIKGENVTCGYYNNADATEKAMAGGEWLRTGDLGFIRDGALYITGRCKDIIFKNGQNYYPHDIERVTGELKGIELNRMAVAGWFNQDVQKEEVLVFVVHRGDPKTFIPTARAIQTFINQRIGFGVDKVIPVKHIPRTTSGKLERYRLLEWYRNGDLREIIATMDELLHDEEAAPISDATDELERSVLCIWQDVLQRTDIRVTDRFFEIGGNSLKAAEVAMKVLQELGADLPLDTTYRKQSVRELAEAIRTVGEPLEYRPIPAAPSAPHHRLSAAQQRLYYFWELQPDSLAYNLPVAFALAGKIDPLKLQGCLQALIDRHELWRAAFFRKGEPRFRVQAGVSFTLDVLDCPRDRSQERLRGLVRPFHLAEDLLFRFALLRQGEEEHILFADFHHIVSDGTSIYHFAEELMRLYAGERLPAPAVRYSDYTVWEEGWFRKVLPQGLYWSEHLGGGLPVLDMPTDRPRPLLLATTGEKLAFGIDGPTTERLRRMARANDCTLHVLLFTLYNLLLAKYTGQQAIMVGIPVSGRRHPDLARVQGLFVNELAIKSVLDSRETFTRLLERQKENMAAAFRHQEYPFSEVADELRRERDLSRNPLFDTMFLYQNMGVTEWAAAGVTLSRHFFDPGFSKFDLSLELFEEKGTLSCYLEYSSQLFTRETAAAIIHHFHILTGKVLAHPDSRLADLHLLDETRYRDYLRTFNETSAALPAEPLLHRLFEEQVAGGPEKIAIEYRAARISYRQLNAGANRLARLLRKKGVERNSIVAIRMHPSPALVMSMLAVLKAGGCYLPVDTDLPAERVSYLLADSQCRWMIVGAADSSRSSDHIRDQRVELIPADMGVTAEGSDEGLENGNSPRDLAYIIYTSGTTGRPKGVMIEHRSLVNYILWAAQTYVKDGEGSCALYTSISFDLTVTSLFVPLLTGNRILIYEEEDRELFIDKIVTDNKAAIVKLTPSHVKLLSASPLPAGGSRIRAFVVGGEQLENKLAEDIYRKFGGRVGIYNEYGPTEATVGCMIHRFEPGREGTVVPIGVPIANTRIYLLDEALQPVPAGVKGELYIAGLGTARGYLFNRELTEQKFIPDPFYAGDTMYKTGDIAKRLPGGILEYTGRYDQQVKINGYRIEPAEIEAHLLTIEGITEALVLPGTNAAGRPRLLAYYVQPAGSDHAMDEAMLREHLAARLPHYMLPWCFIRIHRIPLTRNGKIDIAALPEPATDEPGTVAGQPKNEVERLSLQVWREVLANEAIGVLDNFYELGGDSIKAVQIASRLVDKGISLRPKDILTYPTIAHVSRHARPIEGAKGHEQGVLEGKKDLSPIESWFFRLGLSSPNHYNQSVLLSLKREVQPELLALALRMIVTHHDGLRLNWDPAEGVLFYNNEHLEKEMVVDRLPMSIPLLYAWKGGFDLARSLLIRAALIGGSGPAELLLITAHHLVMDGVSWRILLEDLYTVYQALEQGASVRLSPKTAPLTEYARHLHARVGEASDGRLADHADFRIPLDRETTNWTVENLQTVTGILSEEKTAFLLKEANRPYKTDASVILHTALALALKKWTGRDTVVMEIEHHGRQLVGMDVSRTIGWFTAMYPLQLVCKDGPPGEQLKAVQEAIRRGPALSFSGTSELSEIRFNYLGQFGSELDNDLFAYNRRSSGSDVDLRNAITAKMELNAMVVYGELTVELRFNKQAHKEATAHWVLGAFFEHLEGILESIKREHPLPFGPSDLSGVDLDERELNELFN